MNNTNCDACTCYATVVDDQAEVETVFIPVVVHVIYSTPSAPENVSMEQIESMISKLNQDFRAVDNGFVSPKIEFF